MNFNWKTDKNNKISNFQEVAGKPIITLKRFLALESKRPGHARDAFLRQRFFEFNRFPREGNFVNRKLFGALSMLLVLGMLALMSSCRPHTSVSSSEIVARLKNQVNLDGYKQENLTELAHAQKYGLSTKDVANGVCLHKDGEKPDCLIVVKAKDRDSLENVERSLGNWLTLQSDSLVHDKEQTKRMEKALFKTYDTVVIVAVHDDVKAIEESFDAFVRRDKNIR